MSKNRNQGTKAPLSVSQNFLTGYKTIESLLRKTSLSSDDHVIEIGPGKGHITGQLLLRCGRVSAVELDPRLHERLSEKFRDSRNLRLYHQDFLTWRLPPSGSYKIFANIPFSRTTDIMQKLTDSPNPPSEAWLTMERGAALRFLGQPRESLRSLLIKPLFELRILHRFRREDFHPCPGVDVVLLHLHRKPEPDIPQSQRREYARFMAAALETGGLRRLFTNRQLTRALREAGVNDGPSANMLYVQWLCLFRCLCSLR